MEDSSNTTWRRLNPWRWGSEKWLLDDNMGEFIYRHHVVPRVKLYVPKEETFDIFNEVHRRYQNNSKLIHPWTECWKNRLKITGTWMVRRELSDAWTRLHKIHLFELKDTWWKNMVRRRDLQENKLLLKPWRCMARYVYACVWCRERRKQNKDGLSRNHKLDNARQLSGIFFIEPDDEEFKLMTQSRSDRMLEVPMPAAMPCKLPIKSSGENHRNVGRRKTRFACVVHADESTRPRIQGAITAKGTNSMTHYSLVHKFIPMPQAMKIPNAKAAVVKEWEKLEKISAWNLTKVRSKKQVIDEARNNGRKVHVASLMDVCLLVNSELEPQ